MAAWNRSVSLRPGMSPALTISPNTSRGRHRRQEGTDDAAPEAIGQEDREVPDRDAHHHPDYQPHLSASRASCVRGCPSSRASAWAASSRMCSSPTTGAAARSPSSAGAVARLVHAVAAVLAGRCRRRASGRGRSAGSPLPGDSRSSTGGSSTGGAAVGAPPVDGPAAGGGCIAERDGARGPSAGRPAPRLAALAPSASQPPAGASASASWASDGPTVANAGTRPSCCSITSRRRRM